MLCISVIESRFRNYTIILRKAQGLGTNDLNIVFYNFNSVLAILGTMKTRPTTIVLFGITGDLAQKKLLPAIYDLYVSGRLKDTQIVGFSRRDLSKKEIEDVVKATIKTSNFEEKFLDLITYVSGQFDDLESYKKLAMHLADVCDKKLGDCRNKLFYLSVPPKLYEIIWKNI